jgi:GntR family transcriptional regulator, transcriptional repressor for pyruvate dehydrogenase complex
MLPFRPKSTMSADIAKELNAMILRGDFKPGESLPPQKELAAQLGVGISTVREAVQGLVAMGLLESHPGKGTWVRPDATETLFNPSVVKARLGSLDARMVYETRSVIEVGLTEFAAERATPDEIERIWDALKAMHASVDDVEGFLRADLEFHLAVAEASHNDLLCQFYHLSRKLVSEVIAQLVQVPLVRADSVDIQREIARTIAERDPVQARLAALKHMQYISPFFASCEEISEA